MGKAEQLRGLARTRAAPLVVLALACSCASAFVPTAGPRQPVLGLAPAGHLRAPGAPRALVGAPRALVGGYAGVGRGASTFTQCRSAASWSPTRRSPTRRRVRRRAQREVVKAGLLESFSLGVSLLVLTLVVAIHEGGHFLAARGRGIKVKNFSVGFGPSVASAKPGGEDGVEYSLRLIPVGGFVSFPQNYEEDEEGVVTEVDDPDLLQNRGLADRALVICAGVMANLVLAWACLFGSISTQGLNRPHYAPGVVVNEVTADSGPAAAAGLRPKDVLLSIDGLSIQPGAVDKAVGAVRHSAGRPIALDLLRGENKATTVMVEPTLNEGGVYTIGVRLAANVESVDHVEASNPVVGAGLALAETADLVRTTFNSFLHLATTRDTEGLSGPVQVLKVGAEVVEEDGAAALLQFAAIISVNLAVVNSLPVPGLDGGQMVFILAELARGGRKINRGVMESINGVALLLLLMVSLSALANDLGAVTLLERLVTGSLPPGPGLPLK